MLALHHAAADASSVNLRHLGFAPIAILRMARAGKLPTIEFPIGSTGKYLYRFRLSQLQAHVESLNPLPVAT